MLSVMLLFEVGDREFDNVSNYSVFFLDTIIHSTRLKSRDVENTGSMNSMFYVAWLDTTRTFLKYA